MKKSCEEVSVRSVRKAIRDYVKGNKEKPFSIVVSPVTFDDLQSDEDWERVSGYIQDDDGRFVSNKFMEFPLIIDWNGEATSTFRLMPKRDHEEISHKKLVDTIKKNSPSPYKMVDVLKENK